MAGGCRPYQPAGTALCRQVMVFGRRGVDQVDRFGSSAVALEDALVGGPVGRVAGAEAVQAALPGADDVRVAGGVAAEVVGEAGGELVAAGAAEGVAGAKPQQRVGREALADGVEARAVGVAAGEGGLVERLAIDAGEAPVAVAPVPGSRRSADRGRRTRASRALRTSSRSPSTRRGGSGRRTAARPPTRSRTGPGRERRCRCDRRSSSANGRELMFPRYPSAGWLACASAGQRVAGRGVGGDEAGSARISSIQARAAAIARWRAVSSPIQTRVSSLRARSGGRSTSR